MRPAPASLPKMQLRWMAPLIIGTAVMALVPTALAAERLKQRGAWRPAEPVQLNGQWPLCPVDLSRKVPTKPVRAGRTLSTRVQVINTGSTPLNALNVQVGLPSDVCAYKTGKRRTDRCLVCSIRAWSSQSSLLAFDKHVSSC